MKKQELKKQELNVKFVERLEQERISAGLTQTEMARHLELSLSGYKKIISGETSKIDLYTAYRLGQVTGKSIAEFFEEPHSEVAHISQRLRQLSPLQYNFVSSVIEFESSFLIHTPPFREEDYVNLLIPTGNLQDGMIWDTANLQKLNVSHYRRILGSRLHCALQVTTNHLRPAYNKNDILLISKSAPRDGDIGVFINKETHCCYLRRFWQLTPWVLEPINDYGVTFQLDYNTPSEMDKWLVFGKVLTKMRSTGC